MKKSIYNQLIFSIFISIVIISILATYYRYLVLRDYVTIDDTEETLMEESENI